MNIDFPIDIVFIWVDGSDPEFLAEKNKYSNNSFFLKQNSSDNLYRDLNTLPYAVNSVLKFAPWTNNIFIVTNGQSPNDLPNDPKIKYICHQDFFKFPDHLPTFNSGAIETNLCFIEDLAEHFIFFNDDTFLGKPASPEDFFLPDGRYYFFLHNHPLPKYSLINRLCFFPKTYLCNLMKSADVFQKTYPKASFQHFEKWTGSFCNIVHQARPSRKTALKDLWDHEVFSHEIKKASASRFRAASNIYAFYLAGLLAHETGKAKLSFSCDEVFKYFTDRNVHDKTIYKVIKELRPLLFCINDNMNKKQAIFQKNLLEFLEDYFNN